MFIVPQNKKGTVAVTVLEAFLFILTTTDLCDGGPAGYSGVRRRSQ
jgi:hypothetical protein